ncbi:DUF1616 domain-containing protein [Infirmifilum lucidum]|uniref:DUF1616 domain-containing protein n=1 Tax=Infirmifilum lucidum TaxID=2776706 RepID=A0A7L9FHU7_9CREN|nr:DUF1616 domain-containing protein [Infirmifilum lucidum]QOJ79297.1 DUF1616 domain-containing protein [Infirmifilum lucidum]
MILDEEVFAVVLAIITVASVFAAAQILRQEVTEPFTALGLLNSQCRIGDYPRRVVPGQPVDLCVFVGNYEGKPIYYKVVFKVGTNQTIPSNSSPSPDPPLKAWRGVLAHGENATFKVSVVVPPSLNSSRVALIFELWVYDTSTGRWRYTGRWTHLYVDVVKPGV